MMDSSDEETGFGQFGNSDGQENTIVSMEEKGKA